MFETTIYYILWSFYLVQAQSPMIEPFLSILKILVCPQPYFHDNIRLYIPWTHPIHGYVIYTYTKLCIYIYHNRYVYHGMSSYSNDIFIWVFPKMGDPQHILFIMENSIFRGTTISGNLHILYVLWNSHKRSITGPGVALDLARRSLESAPAVPAAATPLGRCSPRWYPADEIMGSLERCGLS